MYQLRTFGALDLTGVDGSSVDVLLAQPKRSLLLVYLASALPHGYHRRDVLVARFWPELDSERARGALRKGLHFLRSSLRDAVLTRGDEVAVDAAMVRCDAVEFERAEADGRYTDAMALYRGEFLPGIFAKDAPDVERWIQSERTRLAGIAARTAWTLAESAVSSDPAAAAHWSALARSFTPDDEGALRRLMMLLDRIGARAAALRAYDQFAGALASDYAGAQPADSTRDLRDRLLIERTGPTLTQPPAATVPPSLSAESATASALAPASVSTPAFTARDDIVASPTRPTSRARAGSALMALGGVAALLAVAFTLRPRPAAIASATELDTRVARTVAVMPFTIRGGRIAYLREGMVDLMSIGLDGAGEIRPIEPAMLLGYLATDTSDADEVTRARSAARRFGADRFVLGTIVDAGGRLEARVGVYTTADIGSTPFSVAVASANESNVVALADELTRKVVAATLDSRTLRLSQLAARTTTSLPALKSYLSGAQALRAGRYDEAIAAFDDAVRADTTFALAYYGLSMARGWASGGADHNATVAAGLAVRHASGLSQHDSLLLVAHFDNWVGRMTQAEQEYRRLVASYPTDAEAWHELGEVIFHGGATTGHAMRDARDAFTHVGTLDAIHFSALNHLARIAAVEHDSTALDSLARHVERAAPGDPRVAEILTLRDFVAGGAITRARLVAAAAARSDGDILALARDLATYASAWREAEAVALHLTAPARPAAVRALGWTTVAEIRAAAGRPAAARAAAAQARVFDARQAADMRGYLASFSFLPASAGELVAAREELLHRDDKRPAAPDAAHAPEAALTSGASPGAPQLLLTAIAVRSARPLTAPSARDSLLELWTDAMRLVALAASHPQDGAMHARARTSIDELATQWIAAQQGATPRSENIMRLARAELLHRIGDNADAVHWYATFPAFGRDDAICRAAAAFGRAESEEALGDRRAAAHFYAEAAWLWRDAEPELLARARRAEARAAALLAPPSSKSGS